MKMRAILGSFSFLRLRSRMVGQPGLTVYADAGISAAVDLGNEVRDLAHKNEVTEIAASSRIKAMLADNRIDPAELAELARLPASLDRCASRSHDITEAVQL